MDVLFADTGDGGEFVLEGGDLSGDNSLYNALYLSLFGGDNFSNVYEEYESDNEFQEALNQSISLKSLQNVEAKAKKALKWMIDEGVAGSIEVSAKGNLESKINVDITITEPNGEDYPFAVIWENERAILRSV